MNRTKESNERIVRDVKNKLAILDPGLILPNEALRTLDSSSCDNAPFVPADVEERPEEAERLILSRTDLTLLKQDATAREIALLCSSALLRGAFSVCVNPNRAALAVAALAGTDVKVAAVVGFPLGASLPNVVAAEAATLVDVGVDEIDLPIPVGLIKDGNLREVRNFLMTVRNAIPGIPMKVILETCLLQPEDIVTASLIALSAGADQIKTSTGFSTGGATVEAVSLMRAVAGNFAGVKASGGIRDVASALAMLRAGASRIGASAINPAPEGRADGGYA
jgi:deoxyribose-phosphate aldolase